MQNYCSRVSSSAAIFLSCFRFVVVFLNLLMTYKNITTMHINGEYMRKWILFRVDLRILRKYLEQVSLIQTSGSLSSVIKQGYRGSLDEVFSGLGSGCFCPQNPQTAYRVGLGEPVWGRGFDLSSWALSTNCLTPWDWFKHPSVLDRLTPKFIFPSQNFISLKIPSKQHP